MEARSVTGDVAPPDSARNSRRHIMQAVTIGLWTIVVCFQLAYTIANPGLLNIITSVAFLLLCTFVNAQIVLMQWSGNRNWRRLVARMHGSAYLSDLHDLPNRNYLLAEIRREMPRARTHSSPFVLVHISFDTIDQVGARRGETFADRAVNALTDLLNRVTRNSDFIAHMGGAKFCVMLNDCTAEQSWIYLQRIPSTIAVSDGRQMFEVPVSVRVHEYDLESIYATDVLREAEQAAPLRRRDDIRQESWTEAA